MRLRLLTLAVLSATAHSLLAQDLPAGTRVRVRTADVVVVPGVGRIQAEVLRLDGTVTRGRDTVTVMRPSGDEITLPRSGTVLAGDVVTSDADTLAIRLDGRDVRVSIPRQAVRQLEVSRGRRPHSTRRGIAVGFGIGAAAGGLLGLAAGDDRCPPGRPNEGFFGWNGCLALFSAEDKAAMGATAFGALGAVIGAAVGAQRAERWETVPAASPKIKLGVRPVGRRGLALTLGF